MTQEKEQFEDIEIYPAEASEQGCNAFYLDSCEHVGHRPAYAACLKKVELRKHGRLDISYSDCSAAIGKKECRAMKMRKEELAEGRALYFINRNKLRSFQQYQAEMEQQRFAAMSFGKTDKKGPKARPEPVAPKIEPAKPQHFLDMNTGSYADAINAAIKPKEPAEPAPKSVQQTPAPVAPVKAGMSLLEMARLQMAAKASV